MNQPAMDVMLRNSIPPDICTTEDCRTRAGYNYRDSTCGIKCRQHAYYGMIDVRSSTNTSIGYPAFRHASEDMAFVHELYRRVHMAAERHPSVDEDTESSSNTSQLDEQNETGVVNTSTLRCEVERCARASTYNFKGEKTAARCYYHKLDHMVNVTGPRCQIEDCKTRPTFNYPGKPGAIRCGLHNEPGMVYIIRNPCGVDGCMKRKTFSFHGKHPATRCSIHKEYGMHYTKKRRRDDNTDASC